MTDKKITLTKDELILIRSIKGIDFDEAQGSYTFSDEFQYPIRESFVSFSEQQLQQKGLLGFIVLNFDLGFIKVPKGPNLYRGIGGLYGDDSLFGAPRCIYSTDEAIYYNLPLKPEWQFIEKKASIGKAYATHLLDDLENLCENILEKNVDSFESIFFSPVVSKLMNEIIPSGLELPLNVPNPIARIMLSYVILQTSSLTHSECEMREIVLPPLSSKELDGVSDSGLQFVCSLSILKDIFQPTTTPILSYFHEQDIPQWLHPDVSAFITCWNNLIRKIHTNDAFSHIEGFSQDREEFERVLSAICKAPIIPLNFMKSLSSHIKKTLDEYDKTAALFKKNNAKEAIRVLLDRTLEDADERVRRVIDRIYHLNEQATGKVEDSVLFDYARYLVNLNIVIEQQILSPSSRGIFYGKSHGRLLQVLKLFDRQFKSYSEMPYFVHYTFELMILYLKIQSILSFSFYDLIYSAHQLSSQLPDIHLYFSNPCTYWMDYNSILGSLYDEGDPWYSIFSLDFYEKLTFLITGNQPKGLPDEGGIPPSLKDICKTLGFNYPFYYSFGTVQDNMRFISAYDMPWPTVSKIKTEVTDLEIFRSFFGQSHFKGRYLEISTNVYWSEVQSSPVLDDVLDAARYHWRSIPENSDIKCVLTKIPISRSHNYNNYFRNESEGPFIDFMKQVDLFESNGLYIGKQVLDYYVLIEIANGITYFYLQSDSPNTGHYLYLAYLYFTHTEQLMRIVKNERRLVKQHAISTINHEYKGKITSLARDIERLKDVLLQLPKETQSMPVNKVSLLHKRNYKLLEFTEDLEAQINELQAISDKYKDKLSNEIVDFDEIKIELETLGISKKITLLKYIKWEFPVNKQLLIDLLKKLSVFLKSHDLANDSLYIRPKEQTSAFNLEIYFDKPANSILDDEETFFDEDLPFRKSEKSWKQCAIELLDSKSGKEHFICLKIPFSVDQIDSTDEIINKVRSFVPLGLLQIKELAKVSKIKFSSVIMEPIHRILENALRAIESIENKEIIFSIDIKSDKLLLMFQNNGPAIPKSLNIFENGVSGANSTGQGLFYAKQCIEDNFGGTISVKRSTPVIFTISIPLQEGFVIDDLPGIMSARSHTPYRRVKKNEPR